MKVILILTIAIAASVVSAPCPIIPPANISSTINLMSHWTIYSVVPAIPEKQTYVEYFSRWSELNQGAENASFDEWVGGMIRDENGDLIAFDGWNQIEIQDSSKPAFLTSKGWYRFDSVIIYEENDYMMWVECSENSTEFNKAFLASRFVSPSIPLETKELFKLILFTHGVDVSNYFEVESHVITPVK